MSDTKTSGLVDRLMPTEQDAWDVYWAAHPDKDPLTCCPFPSRIEIMEFAFLKKLDQWAVDRVMGKT